MQSHIKGLCPRCGFVRPLNTFRKEWTGQRVCRDCFDPRHPQMNVRAVPDRQSVSNPAPKSTAVFIDANRFLILNDNRVLLNDGSLMLGGNEVQASDL